jgi:acetylornithine deacetylase/succinyl-diaminopimelate desuccinylase-like protein
MTEPDMTLAPVLDRIDADMPAALERLLDLLRIPSISTDPAFKPDCDRAADWMVSDLASMGFEARKCPTPGHPMVVAHYPGPEGAPHLLFYGHYDVQPVDPLNLWDRDPFDPEVQQDGGRTVIRGRGAADDKGQLMTFVEAFRAWIAVHGALPARITVFLEGEEESGSPSLIPFMQEHADELRCDLAIICDTGMFESRVPAITTMLRGLLGEELTVRAANKDLHSGSFGGAAANPIRILARALASLHDETGRITIAGFYDDVPELPGALRAQWQGLAFDHAKFLGDVGLALPAGEVGRTPLEMLWSRPTCEINGIWGGYTGAGFKTVLPAEAHAKVSFRLVGQQDPWKLREAFRDHIRAHIPADCSVEFHGHGNAPASVMPVDNPAFERARAALTDEWGVPAAYIGCGGSIPIAGYFQGILGVDAMLIGFGKDDDQIHSPNEKYDLESFHKGIRSWARILARIAD